MEKKSTDTDAEDIALVVQNNDGSPDVIYTHADIAAGRGPVETLNLMENNCANPLILTDSENGYKVNKPLDQSGEYVDKRIADDLLEALQKIANWELPDSGRTWDDGAPMSYGAANGTNGERDYIKSIAKAAIAKAQMK